MSAEREWIDDNLAAYALGALDAADRARMEALLERDAAAAAEARELSVSADLLSHTLEPVAPPAYVRERLLDKVRASARSRASNAADSTAPRRGWFALAAAALVVAAVAIGVIVARNAVEEARRSAERDTIASIDRVLTLKGTGKPDAHAHFLVGDDGRTGTFQVAGLAPLAPGRTYQLWFKEKDKAPVSGGTFAVDASGRATLPAVAMVPVDQLVAMAVTEEAAPGVPLPTNVHLVDLVR